MRVAIASDHRGLGLKRELIGQPYDLGSGEVVEWIDVGPTVFNVEDDYPDFAVKTVTMLNDQPDIARAVLVCGSGIGMAIVANKFVGIRCGVGLNARQVHAARADDDINILSVAADFVTVIHARVMVEEFLKTPYSNLPAHNRRLEEIRKLEEGKNGN